MIHLTIEFFCKERGIKKTDLDNPKRRCNVWVTRYMIWYYLHYNAGLSASQLAREFSRSRDSIFRGIRTIKHHFRFDNNLRNEYHDIVAKIEGASSDTPSEDMES